MRVTLTNLTSSPLSTVLGLVEAGSTASFDVTPSALLRVASGLETARLAGQLLYRTSNTPTIPDELEVSSAQAGGSVVASDVVILPAAVKTLNATPVVLVPAPGPGRALVFNGMLVSMTYAGTAYDGIAAGEDLSVKYTGASGAIVGLLETTGFLDATSSQLRWVYPGGNAVYLPSCTPVANAPLVAHMLSGEVGPAGNSPLVVRTFFRVVPSAL